MSARDVAPFMGRRQAGHGFAWRRCDLTCQDRESVKPGREPPCLFVADSRGAVSGPFISCNKSKQGTLQLRGKENELDSQTRLVADCQRWQALQAQQPGVKRSLSHPVSATLG